eukprot:CAMPEP_0172303258 /NCGR_PEP_ID=MMETSP1058-20130122/4817_1 /TAXON_ID=83371 /ORGANISM="Detonula confervacea, Strain CCMP 353" /LENGTH=589 /DNA_ID=CAMNT_0013014003 /DNA_START=219 /DNA_END=1986 /DNA_ORIENTATION=+
MNRREGMVTLSMLVILTAFAGVVFSHLFSSVTQEQEQHQFQQSRQQSTIEINESPAPDDADDGENEPPAMVLPFDLGTRMREWLAKKQLMDGFFYTPLDSDAPMRHYSAKEIKATIPHFKRELLLVMYASETDEFIVLVPGLHDGRTPKCEAGCLRIESIMHAILYAFRNRYPRRFEPQGPSNDGQDFLFLVSTGDSPRLSQECLARPGGCGRRKAFAPILHFGSGFSDDTILPSLITMPPTSKMHLHCMAEWMIRHEVCEFLMPKRKKKDGSESETDGIVFGEHINYNMNGAKRIGDKKGGLVWEDLIPQVVWRGGDAPYLPLLNQEMRPPDYSTDVEPKLKEYGRGVGGIIRALNDVYDKLRPRWKAVMITAQAEFEANAKNNNPKRKSKRKVMPWANMKFSAVANDHETQFYQQYNDLGIPAIGEQISMLELAKYKYHIDLGGSAGTSPDSTIRKLALPGLLFHHVTAAKDWYHEHLVPFVHYVPVKEDLSDLHEMYEWAEMHDRKSRSIAKAGTEFVRRLSRPEGLDELSRRHLLKPLEDLIQAYEPTDISPVELLGSGDDGLVFKEVMDAMDIILMSVYYLRDD